MFGDAYTKYGITAAPASGPTELNALPSPAPGGDPTKLLSLSNPLTAFAVIGAIAFGLAGFATTVRVGNSSASLNLGKG